MIIGAYRALVSVLFPLINATYIRHRRRIGKEHPERFHERLADYTYPRPSKKLYWMHGASVGESISMLPLIDKLLKEDETLSIMVTTGTVTSAEIMAKRLPERAFHQFFPFDTPKTAAKLMAHFKPDAVLWFESELWPAMLFEIKKSGVPFILVNGRVSDRSFKRWKKFRLVAKELLSCFTLCLGQSEQDRERLAALGAVKTDCVGNLKYAGMPLPVDVPKMVMLKSAIGERRVFFISSTHHNEEEQLAQFLPELKKEAPDVLTIIAPRHPNRGDEIVEMLKSKGFISAQRSKEENLTAKTEVYVADTIGEMGLWYGISDICFVGGSLIPHGGQNFIEPARDKNAVILGPHTHNFTDMTARALEAKAVTKVSTAQEVVKTAAAWFKAPDELKTAQEKAYLWTVKEAAVLDGIAEALNKELGQ